MPGEAASLGIPIRRESLVLQLWESCYQTMCRKAPRIWISHWFAGRESVQLPRKPMPFLKFSVGAVEHSAH